MSWTLGMVKARVRALLDDPQASWVTDDYVEPLANQVYEDACSQMVSTQSSWDISVVEVPGIQPLTPNLLSLQVGSGPLATLTDQPERIDWKPAGNDPSYYQLVPNYGVLPDFQPQQNVPGWEWRSETIWLGQFSVAVDLRIRGEFAPVILTADSSVLTAHPRIGYVVAYGTAALIANVRGNEAWATKYGQQALEGMDLILQELVRNEQGQVRRIGRQTRRGNSGWAVPQSN